MHKKVFKFVIKPAKLNYINYILVHHLCGRIKVTQVTSILPEELIKKGLIALFHIKNGINFSIVTFQCKSKLSTGNRLLYRPSANQRSNPIDPK